MSGGTTPDRAKSYQRWGLETTCGRPAASLPFEPRFTSDDRDPADEGVENPNIKASGHQDKPLPGKYDLSGAIASLPDGDGHLPALMTAHRQISAITDLGNGAYRYTLGRSAGTDVASSLTAESDRDDGVRVLDVGMTCISYSLAVANGSPVTLTVNLAGAYQTPWRTAEERHPNPGSGLLYLRGWPPEWIDRADGDAGHLSLTLVDLYTDAQSRVQAVWMARVGATRPITGTWTVSAGTKAFTGSGGAAETDLVSGDVFEHEGEILTVDVVTDDDTFTSLENHTAGSSAKKIVREYGTAAQGALYFFETRPGVGSQTSLPRWWPVKHSSGISGGFMGDRDTSGTTVEAHLTASTGIVAGTTAALPSGGTMAVTAGSAVVTGTGTDFVADLKVGDKLITNGGQERRVIKITSTTSVTCDSTFTTTESTAAGTYRPTPRVALTGTHSTAGSTALVAVGGAYLTELAIGSEVRTAGGEVNRVLSITDNDNAVMTKAWTGTEPAVAASVPYEYDVQRERASWVESPHASGPFIELLAEVHTYLSTTNVPEELVEIAKSSALEFTAGKAPDGGIGRKWTATVGDEGSSSGTWTLVLKNLSNELRKAILSRQTLRIRQVMSTGKQIGTSPYEYGWEFIGHISLSGKPGFVPDTSNNITLTGSLFDDAADPDGYTDALQVVVTSDRATPNTAS